MLRRRTLLSLSVVLAGLFYSSFFAAAPYVTLMAANTDLPETVKYFRIELKQPEEIEPPEVQPEKPAELVSRPGSINDLITKREDEAILQESSGPAAPVEVPNMSDRIATEAISRDHDLTYNEIVPQKADAKIIEIARSEARTDIDVPRRFVRPSPDRILPPGEFPTLRSEAAEPGQIPMEFDRRGINLLGKPVGMPGGVPGGLPGALPASVPPPPPEIKPEIQKAMEKPKMDVPVKKEMESARKQSDYQFLDDLVDIKISAYTPADEAQGYFELRIQPKESGKMEILPKDVTFVLDASRSIIQHKLDVASRGVAQAFQKLRAEDYFNVVFFRDTPNMFQPQRVPATDANKAAATAFLQRLESKGQTDVYNAMRPVVNDAPRKGAAGIVLLVSDGRPTTGLKDSRSIINALTGDNNLRNSIFSFGAGNTVNRYMLDLISYRNKGKTKVVSNVDDTTSQLPAFFEEFNDPILTDIKVDYSRVDEENIFPKVIPDFYRKGAVSVYGRFDPKKDMEFVMRLTGHAWNREKELIFRARLKDAAPGESIIASHWAFTKSYYIIGLISQQGETPELLGQLKALSDRYNIRTTYSE